MRIISGIHKGKKINYTKSPSTRPLRDLVKENIFNIIEHSNLTNVSLKNSKILDLYSGSGSFGFECLSRGSSEVIFIERSPSITLRLEENLNKLGMIEKAKLIQQDTHSFVKKYKKTNYFDIIFLDPPYVDQDYHRLLDLINKEKLCKKNHLIIIHREKGKIEEKIEEMNIIQVKNYGRSKVLFVNFF